MLIAGKAMPDFKIQLPPNGTPKKDPVVKQVYQVEPEDDDDEEEEEEAYYKLKDPFAADSD